MQILQIFWDRRELFITCLLEHIRISLTAVLCAGILGILTGILISRHKKAAGVVLGIVNVIYTIPSISLLGFLIPLTGIGNRTAIIALTVYGLLPIVRNTYTGLTTVDAPILGVAEGLGSDGRQMMFRIRFPLALPVIISGFRNMVVMIIAMGGIASFIGAGVIGKTSEYPAFFKEIINSLVSIFFWNPVKCSSRIYEIKGIIFTYIILQSLMI